MEWIAAIAGIWVFFQYVLPILVVAILAFVIYRWVKGQSREFTSTEPRKKHRRDY